MTILITGGGGYIGSHVTLEALKSDLKVIVLDDFSTSYIENIERLNTFDSGSLEIISGDICDENLVNKIFKNQSIKTVIHLAAKKSVEESNLLALDYYQTNIKGSLTLLDVMKKNNVNEFIFSSTAAVYGNSNDTPFKETADVNPVNPYARSKLMLEKIIQDTANSQSGLKSVILRYFNPVGADESYLIGESPKGETHNLFPKICKVLSGSQEYIEVYGDDYPTQDGSGVRDFIHITDLALGHLTALTILNRSSQNFCSILNLGNGQGYSVKEVIKMFERVTGKSIPYKIRGRRLGDVATSYADASLAKKEMNWSSRKDLEAMCRDSWNWHLKNN
mgnify:CR=1 FL=1|tara:strand:+ start:18150 stop:19154 length:1005 start_codon:yes stop_codon:yes gene_type:complete